MQPEIVADYQDMRDVYRMMRLYGTPERHRIAASTGDTPFAQHVDPVTGKRTLQPFDFRLAESIVTNRLPNVDIVGRPDPYITMAPRAEDWVETTFATKETKPELENPRHNVGGYFAPRQLNIAPTSLYLEDRKRDVARINYLNDQYVKSRLESLPFL